jgi:hypothetical protein
LFLPVPYAVDTFYAATEKIAVVKKVSTNVALKKTIESSSSPNDPSNLLQAAANAVDGLYDPDRGGSMGRWVCTSATPPRFLIIDLDGEYTINGLKLWNGNNGDLYTAIYPMSKINLDIWIDGGWVTVHEKTGHNSGFYSAEFTPVTTTKVKFWTDEQVRLYEIEIYSDQVESLPDLYDSL